MSRYIDADAVTKAINDQQDGTGVTYEALAHAMRDVMLIPSIDIVRCKECKWKRLYDEGDTKYYYCALEDRPNRQWSVDDTDYCSWAERSE